VHSAIRVRTLVAFLIMFAVASPALAGERLDREPVMVALARAMSPDPLPYRSQMFLTDRVKTGNHGLVRLLLGGRVLLMAREGSTLNITEVPGAATIEVEAGRIAVTVDRENLHPEDLIEVRTPHAVVSVPGDTLVVDVADGNSTFTVLGTRVEVFRLDPLTGVAVEPPTPADADEVVIVGPVVTPTDLASR
jgi:hypothetical protein